MIDTSLLPLPFSFTTGRDKKLQGAASGSILLLKTVYEVYQDILRMLIIAQGTYTPFLSYGNIIPLWPAMYYNTPRRPGSTRISTTENTVI